MKMKKAALALALSFALLFAACAGQPKNSESMEDVQLPNPVNQWSTLEEAAEKTGFSLEAGQPPQGFEQAEILTIEENLIQLTFQKGEERLVVRKGKGSEDVSGDYNEYSQVTEETLSDGRTVRLSAEEDKILLATWTENDQWSYSVSAPGLSKDEVLDFVEGTH